MGYDDAKLLYLETADKDKFKLARQYLDQLKIDYPTEIPADEDLSDFIYLWEKSEREYLLRLQDRFSIV